MARFVRRAVLRGGLSAVAGALFAVPLRRRRRRLALTAAVAGLAVGAVQELPAAVLPAGLAGLLVLRGRRADASQVTLGVGLGAAAALGTRRVWPVAPRTLDDVRRLHTPLAAPAITDGEGVTVVVNPAAGSPWQRDTAAALRDALPQAQILELRDDLDLDQALAQAADASVIGIAGGDGSVNAAAGVARRAGKPLFVVPAGTLNHFARDLGVTGVDDAVEALRCGHAVAVDTATIDGRPFLNTASFGTYSDLVDARVRLEGRIGKWPALAVAMVRMLREAEPMDVELDGRRRRLWMVFIGNCRYQPIGFAPAWRERLDDGELDVRLIDGTRPFARARLLAAVLTGQLARSVVYEAFGTKQLTVKTLDGPLRLARDGETFDGSAEFTVGKEDEPLVVYAPRPEPAPEPERNQRPKATSKPKVTTTPTAVSQGPASS